MLFDSEISCLSFIVSAIQNQFISHFKSIFMDRRVTSRLNMANAVEEVCDTRTDVVALVPAFVLLVTSLKNRITALKALMQRVSIDNSGYYADKIKWKDKLALLLSILCGSGVSYAKKIEDPVLEGKFGFADSTLFGMRDTELIEAANSLIALQATVAAQLVEYGITTSFMDDIATALDNFDEMNPKPIVNVYTSEADREELLDMAFGLSEFVLQDMMKAALIYKVLNFNFYQALKNASRIRNAGLRHDKPTLNSNTDNDSGETTSRKEVQGAPTISELLDNHVQEINASAENAGMPTPQEPSMIGN